MAGYVNLHDRCLALPLGRCNSASALNSPIWRSSRPADNTFPTPTIIMIRCASILLLFINLQFPTYAGELIVSTDFEGGSARAVSIDQETRTISLMPGGDPANGWPCWWYFRVDGLGQGEVLKINLAGSDHPARENGKETGYPNRPAWAMPTYATFSSDGIIWSHTAARTTSGAPGASGLSGFISHYKITGTGGPVWVAWGPPFTSSDTDRLIAAATAALPDATAFLLATSRGGRPVRALKITSTSDARRPAIWVQGRQHAWESGSSWVARGFTEWLVSDDDDARWLRAHAEVFIVPIMDVDNVATGNGGKEQLPRDHNRDWDDAPVFPEIAAAQTHLRTLATQGRLDLFIDVHNPGYADLSSFIYSPETSRLSATGALNQSHFIKQLKARMPAPIPVNQTVKYTGPKYHPLWQKISHEWANSNGNTQTVSVTFEAAWNTAEGTQSGYMTVGRQLGWAVTDAVRRNLAPHFKAPPE